MRLSLHLTLLASLCLLVLISGGCEESVSPTDSAELPPSDLETAPDYGSLDAINEQYRTPYQQCMDICDGKLQEHKNDASSDYNYCLWRGFYTPQECLERYDGELSWAILRWEVCILGCPGGGGDLTPDPECPEIDPDSEGPLTPQQNDGTEDPCNPNQNSVP